MRASCKWTGANLAAAKARTSPNMERLRPRIDAKFVRIEVILRGNPGARLRPPLPPPCLIHQSSKLDSNRLADSPRLAAMPPASDRGATNFRWCRRCASQPPANGCDASGIGNQRRRTQAQTYPEAPETNAGANVHGGFGDQRAADEPGGFAAISRWLSEATPPDGFQVMTHPERMPARRGKVLGHRILAKVAGLRPSKLASLSYSLSPSFENLTQFDRLRRFKDSSRAAARFRQRTRKGRTRRTRLAAIGQWTGVLPSRQGGSAGGIALPGALRRLTSASPGCSAPRSSPRGPGSRESPRNGGPCLRAWRRRGRSPAPFRR